LQKTASGNVAHVTKLPISLLDTSNCVCVARDRELAGWRRRGSDANLLNASAHVYTGARVGSTRVSCGSQRKER
jgi:hypothetical protein